MKNRFHKVREVFKIKNHLYRVAPAISNVDVKVSNLNNGRYKTQIFVHIPTRKCIVSTKTDESLPGSLERAHKAVLKQINKTVKSKIKRETIRGIDVDVAA